MANVLTTNPVLVDTAAASVATQRARIKAIAWDGAANGNTLLIHDAAAGNVIFQARANANDSGTIIFAPAEPVDVPGIYVTTIGGGTALIYLA